MLDLNQKVAMRSGSFEVVRRAASGQCSEPRTIWGASPLSAAAAMWRQSGSDDAFYLVRQVGSTGTYRGFRFSE